MDFIRKEIGFAMMEARKKVKIPRTAVAEKLGVSDVAVYYWEIGKNPIDVDVLKDYCDIIGTDWIALLMSTPSYQKSIKKGELYETN